MSILGRSSVALCLMAACGSLAWAQQDAADGAVTTIGVIDVQRLLVESSRGQALLVELKNLREQMAAEGEVLQQGIQSLRERLQEGRQSLSEEGIAEMEKDLEDRLIELRRFADDADRVLQKEQDDAFAKIERDVVPIIDRVGQEQGFTLIFNKFESGLVFAAESVDITDLILQLYDQSVERED